MANGRLAVANITVIDTDVTVYTVPGGSTATVNINVVNRNTTTAVINMAIASGPRTDADYIEFQTALIANGVLERTGLVLSGAETVLVSTDLAGVSVRVHGFEEVIA